MGVNRREPDPRRRLLYGVATANAEKLWMTAFRLVTTATIR